MSKQVGLKISKNSLHNNIENLNTMLLESPSGHSQPILSFKLAKIISNEVINATQGKGRRPTKEEVTLQVLENLLMGVLLRNGDTFEACLQFYSLYNEEDGMSQSSLIEWICRPAVGNIIARQIHQQFENIVPLDQSHLERLPVDAPSSPPSSPFHVKLQARTQGEQSASSARSTRKDQPWDSVFEVINLCSEESNYQNSDIQQSNEEVMIYTHEQIVEELNFQLEGANGGENVDQGLMVAEPQALEVEIHKGQSGVQGIREVSASELQELMSRQSSLSSSSLCGHFLFGDKLQQIIDALCCQNITYFLVSWRSNKTFTAQPSLLPSQTIKTHSPQDLIRFYQHRFQQAK